MEELSIEPPQPCCTVCGAFAVVWIREVIHLAPTVDDKGRIRANWKAGKMSGYCREHKPKPDPIEAGLLC